MKPVLILIVCCLILPSTLSAQEVNDPLADIRAAAVEWESEIVKLEEANNEKVAGPEQILFLGSSSIRLWYSIDKDLPNRQSVRRGYGGARFSDLAVYIDRLIAGHDPQAIVIFVANDISGNAERDISPERVLELARFSFERIRKSLPGTPVYFIEITPTPSRFTHWGKISQANNLLNEMTDEHEGCFFIQTADKYLDENGKPKPELFVADGLHQNAEGYALWASTIEAALQKYLDSASDK